MAGMRRAERLFQIIQILRRSKRRPITANDIASELETSLRTIYRDISQLLAERVPIRGEAGIGYVLEDGFDMPPLMLTADEIEAAMLGAQWVMGRGDASLARAANDLVAKIGAVVPPHLRPLALDSTLVSPNWKRIEADTVDMARMRASIHAQTKVELSYRDESGGRNAPHDLAVRRLVLGHGARGGGVVRAAQGLSQFPDRSGGDGGVSWPTLSRAAHPAHRAVAQGDEGFD
jgi:predicted DNA-binding transcriptional regulator YafY